MRISDWSSDLCSSDLTQHGVGQVVAVHRRLRRAQHAGIEMRDQPVLVDLRYLLREERRAPLVVVNSRRAQIDDGDLPVTLVQQRLCVDFGLRVRPGCTDRRLLVDALIRSEEHTSELQSLMRISYAVFCLKK